MTTQRQALGAYGERLAARHLQALGLVILHRNWRCADGELDLVLRDGDEIVFCEVKTRTGGLLARAFSPPAFGMPSEAIDSRKVRKLRLLAWLWLTETGVRGEGIRFDVVEVLAPRRGAARVTHIRSAF